MFVQKNRILFLFLFLILGLAACNLPDTGKLGGGSSGGNTSNTNGVLSEISQMNGVTVGQQLVFTGSQSASSAGLVDIYDSLSTHWVRDHLSAPRNSMGVGVIGNKAYFVGGISPASQQFDTIDIYNAATGQWSVDHLAVARAGAGVASVGNLLVVGGGFSTLNASQAVVNGGTNSLTSIETIDTSNGTRTQTNLSWPRNNHATVSVGTKVYFIGGYPCYYSYIAACDASNTIDIYDTSSGLVNTIAMPHNRGNATAAVNGTKIVIGGGANFAGALDSIDVFDTSNSQWTTVNTSILGSGSTAISVGGYVVFAGGVNNLNKILRFDPATGLVDSSNTLQYGRYNFISVALNGLVYFGGGVTAPLPDSSRTVEIYDPVLKKVSTLN